MSSIGSNTPASINSDGLSEQFKAVVKANQNVIKYVNEESDAQQDLFEAQQDFLERTNFVKEQVEAAFTDLGEDKEPLDDDNFNFIINQLVQNDDDNSIDPEISLEASNFLKEKVLEVMQSSPGINMSELSEEEKQTLFVNTLTELVAGYSGADDEMSTTEFTTLLTQLSFTGDPFVVTADDSTDDDTTDDDTTINNPLS